MGFVGNINYAQALDLAAGFVGLDPAGDDGYRYGLWPWEDGRLETSSLAGELRGTFFGLPSEPKAGAKPPSRGGVYFGRGHCPMPPVAAAAAPAKEEKK